MGLTCNHAYTTNKHAPREIIHKTSIRIDWAASERAVKKRVPKMQRISTKWFTGTRNLIPLKTFARAIREKDPALVVEALAQLPAPNLQEYDVRISKANHEKMLELETQIAEEMTDTIAEGGMAGGAAAWKALPKAGVKVSGSFTISNPYVVPGAKARVGWLITEVRNGTIQGLREAVAGVIADSYETQIGTRAAARRLRSMVGLLPHQANAVRKVENRLRAAGVTGDGLRNRVDREVSKRLRYRANMIARTEMRRAQATGRHDAWKTARDQGAFRGQEVLVEWVAGLTERTCPICADLHGTTTPLGDDFVSTDNLGESDHPVAGETPPIHPLCRCTTILRLK